VSLARFTRRAALGAALSLAAAAAFAANVTAPQPDDMAIGSPKARVTVIEYASAGCPHCAAWNNDVFPAFKAKYVDTGQVRFVVREMLTGSGPLATAGFMLARCAGPSGYFPLLEDVYRRQASMFEKDAKPGLILQDIAKAHGLDQAAFQKCLDDHAGLDALNARTERHHSADGVDSTPTFFVGGKKVEGEASLADLGAAIRAARTGAAKR
jgi:protein-disulfide isomerase